MNLGKMIKVLDNNHDGIIVNMEKEINDLNIDVEIRYLAKYIDETFAIMKYKIINFREIKFLLDDEIGNCELNEIKKRKLVIQDAEIGKNHSLLINVWHNTSRKGKLYIWANYENDIKIYDQKNNEIEYDRFLSICRRK